MIEVTAEEAQKKGLAGVGFRVDLRGTPMSAKKFTEPGIYLIASGPPGAPLAVIVYPADGREGDAAAVEQAVRRHHSEAWQQPLVIGQPGQVMLGGGSRAALAFMTGHSIEKTAWCGVLVGGKGGSLLVTLGRSPGSASTVSCAEVMSEPSLAAFARTFTML